MQAGRQKRDPEDEDAPEPYEAPAAHVVTQIDVIALRTIAREGGGAHFITPKRITVGEMHALQRKRLIELLDAHGEIACKLTPVGLKAIAADPGVRG